MNSNQQRCSSGTVQLDNSHLDAENFYGPFTFYTKQAIISVAIDPTAAAI